MNISTRCLHRQLQIRSSQVIAAILTTIVGVTIAINMMELLELLSTSNLGSSSQKVAMLAIMFAPLYASLLLFSICMNWRNMVWLIVGRLAHRRFIQGQTRRYEFLLRSGVSAPVALTTIQREAIARYKSVLRHTNTITGDHECNRLFDYLCDLETRISARCNEAGAMQTDKQSGYRGIRESIKIRQAVLRLQGRELGVSLSV